MSDFARVLPLVLVSSVAAAAFSTWLLMPPAPAAEESAAAGDGTEALLRRIEQLEQRLAAAPAATAAPAAARREAVLDEAAVERAVRAWLEENRATVGDTAVAADPAAALPEFEDADEAFAALFAEGLHFDERSALWRRIHEAGLADAVLEAIEEYADLNGADPQAQLVLGEAYLAKVFEVGNGPEAGTWAMKADAAFDAALQADPSHWESRMTKAVSLSNWPPFLGKQNEAIRHFEILVDQQGSAALPHYADTYLILGNLYQQTGRAEDALRVWQQGAGLFPGRQDLLDQIAAVGG